MSLERGVSSYQAIEKLRSLFEWKTSPSPYFPITARHKLNENELIEAQFHSTDDSEHQSFSLRILRGGEIVMGFSMSEEGVEKIWHESVNFSISPPGSGRRGFRFIHTGRTSDELEWDRLGNNLAGIFADWVEEMLAKGKIVNDPLGFIRMTHGLQS